MTQKQEDLQGSEEQLGVMCPPGRPEHHIPGFQTGLGRSHETRLKSPPPHCQTRIIHITSGAFSAQKFSPRLRACGQRRRAASPHAPQGSQSSWCSRGGMQLREKSNCACNDAKVRQSFRSGAQTKAQLMTHAWKNQILQQWGPNPFSQRPATCIFSNE